MRKFTLAVAMLAVVPVHARSQGGFDDPFPAHQVMDNLYFVGTAGLGTYLVTTPEGHILINTDYERTIPLIESSMQTLGFDLADIRIILGSHAHADHQEADVFLRERTGAQVMIMEEDVPSWRRIGGGDAPIDRILHDGEEVTFGGTTLVAHLTPGHTPGCTSWGMELEEGGQTYQALIVCSFSVGPNSRLINNPNYPDQAADYRATFAKVRAMPVDVFVGSHGSFYDLPTKYEALQRRGQGDPNPFIDRAGFLTDLDLQEGRFEALLERRRRGNR
jgi:metallo-beta-lactamase class B